VSYIPALTAVIEKVLRSRTYDRHAYDEETFQDGIADIVAAVLEVVSNSENLEDQRRELEDIMLYNIDWVYDDMMDTAQLMLDAGFRQVGPDIRKTKD
jgi:hypothetical protein